MKAAALIALGLALVGCGGVGAASGPPATSTLEATLVDRDGDGFLERGDGEALRGPRGGRVLATFGQITDPHVRDEESPARVPFLDRLGSPLNSTFRPHEAFSTQVLDAAVRALSRERPQAVVVTGDIVDSAQENELDQALAVLDGAVVAPDSGEPGYDGVQVASNPDPFYFRPDTDAPRHPGALAAAQGRFRAGGLRVPWYPAVGNHDVLVQGEVPATELIEEVATGDRMVTGLDPAFLPPTVDEDDAPEAVRVLLTQGEVFGRAETVPADPARRHLQPAELVERLASAAGVRPAAPDRLDYAFDLGSEVARDRARHGEPRRRLARRGHSRAGRLAADAARHLSLGRRLRPQPARGVRRRGGRARRAGRGAAGGRRRGRQPPSQHDRAARRLLADRHLVAGRLPAAGPHVPPARGA